MGYVSSTRSVFLISHHFPQQPALQPGSPHKHCFPMHMAELEQVPMHDALPGPLRKKKHEGNIIYGNFGQGWGMTWEEAYSFAYRYVLYIQCIFTVMWFLSKFCKQTNSTWQIVCGLAVAQSYKGWNPRLDWWYTFLYVSTVDFFGSCIYDFIIILLQVCTPKTNIEPEKCPLEKEKHLQTINFLRYMLGFGAI